MFKQGKIDGIVVKELSKFVDERGWLAEIFREDEIQEEFMPVMSYVSVTQPGVARGPHEHVEQADNFVFLGPSNFKLYLWDNRKSSPSFMSRQIIYAGEDSPKAVIVPPGVVHAYRNIGDKPGMIVNLPNKLFAGTGRKKQVDEIRHENDPDTIFKLD